MEKERKDMIINFGAFGYSVAKMNSILGEDVSQEMADPNSQFSQLYEQGRDLADYAIDTKLFEMARGGDIKALDKLDLRKMLRGRKKNV